MHRSKIITLGRVHPEYEFGPFGKVYHQVAKLALARLRRKRAVESEDACPVIFLYRHAIELYLKSIIIVADPVFLMSGRPNPQLNGHLYKTHRLNDLFVTVTTIVKPLGIRPGTPILGIGPYANVKKIIGVLAK